MSPAPPIPHRLHWWAVLAVALATVGLVSAVAPGGEHAGATERSPDAARPVSIGSGAWAVVEAPDGPGPHPVLLHVPGGGWQSLDDTPVGTAYGHEDAAQRGWAVVTIGYPTGPDVTAHEQVAAVRAALGWVRGPEGVRLGLGGPVVGTAHSAGAHLLALATLGAGTERPDHLVLAAGVYDLAGDVRASPMLRPGLASALGCTELGCTGGELEPARHVAPDLPPVVLVHGAADRITPAAGSDRYAQALRAAGAAVDLRIVDGGRHRGERTDAAVRQAVLEVIDQLRTARSSR